MVFEICAQRHCCSSNDDTSFHITTTSAASLSNKAIQRRHRFHSSTMEQGYARKERAILSWETRENYTTPIVRPVGLLLPPSAASVNDNQDTPMSQGEVMLSSVSCNGDTVAQFLKYLFERFCPEDFLRLICQHAGSRVGHLRLSCWSPLLQRWL